MKETLSNHFVEDRGERASFILSHIDCGEVIKVKHGTDSLGRGYIKELTDTGLIFIYNFDHTKIVTMWIASLEQVDEIMRHTPRWLEMTVRKNEKYAKYLKKYVEKK